MPHAPTRSVLRRLIGASCLALAVTGTAAAQDPVGHPAPRDSVRMEGVFEEMQAQLQRILPIMMELALAMEEGMTGLEAGAADRPDVAAVARRAARFTRAYFDALLDEGFTREEALRIVSAGGPMSRR
ncbi:MAG: hypothetical protein KY466_14235 [Gemmatimonadetes bacterium]|nr:hypothetical protein [Gemmatimonadota bacterium]